MIRNFTREDFEALKPYEEHLVRAKYGRYVYGLRRPIFDVLVGVYKSLGYSQRLDYSCNGCLLNLCTTLGNYYFPFKEQLEAEQKNEEVTEDVSEDVNEGYKIKPEGNPYPTKPAVFDSKSINEQINEEINEQITAEVKPTTTKKTNGSKAKKTNNNKKTKK